MRPQPLATIGWDCQHDDDLSEEEEPDDPAASFVHGSPGEDRSMMMMGMTRRAAMTMGSSKRRSYRAERSSIRVSGSTSESCIPPCWLRRFRVVLLFERSFTSKLLCFCLDGQ